MVGERERQMCIYRKMEHIHKFSWGPIKVIATLHNLNQKYVAHFLSQKRRGGDLFYNESQQDTFFWF